MLRLYCVEDYGLLLVLHVCVSVNVVVYSVIGCHKTNTFLKLKVCLLYLKAKGKTQKDLVLIESIASSREVMY